MEKISGGAELAAALFQNSLVIGERQSAPFLRDRSINARKTRINQGACNGAVLDIEEVCGLYGNGETSVWGTIKDTTKTAFQSYTLNAAILAKVEYDTGDATDPESRLVGFYATCGYGPDTVGRAVHRAIGEIYLTFGMAGEENFGRVVNSEAAKALYNDPIKSPSSQCMLDIEYLYWENEHSIGGDLGAFIKPRARDCIQRLLSDNRCSSGGLHRHMN